MERPDQKPRRRIRKIDWTEVLRHLDTTPAGTSFLIGRMHRSVATHINRGDYTYIDPAKYEAWSTNRHGNDSQIWMRKR